MHPIGALNTSSRPKAGVKPSARYSAAMMEELNNPQIRKLKALAQRMDAQLKVGKQGLSEMFLKAVDQELSRHELVKIKFAEFKEQKKALAPQLAEKTQSHLVTLLGNVAVLFRRNPDPDKQKIQLPGSAALPQENPAANNGGEV